MIADASNDTLLDEALVHHRAGRLAEAARCYRALLATGPGHADASHLLGLVEHAAGRHAAALTHLRAAVRLRPEVAHFQASLGTASLAAGDLAAAEAGFRAALAGEPENADVWANLGLALLRDARPAEAEAALRAAVRLAPSAADVRGNLGACLHRLGRLDEAAEALRAALRLDLGHEPALACLGLVLEALGELDEAEACHHAALALRPDSAAHTTNLGNVLRVLGRFDEAEALLRRAVRLRPDEADSWANLAAVLAAQGRLAAAEAEACCRRALRLDPGHAEAHTTLGTVQLLAGQMPEGFAGLEWRWRRQGFVAPRAFGVPRWDGAPRGGRTLLLHAEQGLGDSIQMLRFVPALAKAGPVVLEVPATLRGLAAGLDPRVRVTTAGDALPPVDLHCPLPSLPHVLGLTLAEIPERVPYLRADPAAVSDWVARVAGLPGWRIGLAWAGNPAYAADRRRSIPPARLAPLGTVRGVSFVSLQRGAVELPDIALHDWTDELATLSDTAALMSCLDLVIAVDTAVAHLAGALWRPVWLLNRFDSDWRWLREGTLCPWYPTLLQFRQPEPGDWTTVVADVTSRLGRYVAGEVLAEIAD